MTDKEIIERWLKGRLADLYEESQCELPELSKEVIEGKMLALRETLSFINTLEVKEVNLDDEYKDFVGEDPVYNKLVNGIVGKTIAKHFFEIGLRSSNPLTWKDIDLILDITDQIANDDSMEEKLNNMSQEKYCTEVLKRFKAQKGEKV